MAFGRGRRRRAAPTSLFAAGIVLGIVAVGLGILGGAAAAREGISDPRDVRTGLDLKALTHAVEGSSIIYTAEAYDPFTDESVVLTWGIDRDHDEDFDLIVTAEWRGGKLVGAVRDASGETVAAAAVSRPAPATIRVSFPVAALGGAAVYRYAVEGGQDVVPDTGLVQHRLAGDSVTTPPRTAASVPLGTAASAPPPGAASVRPAETPAAAAEPAVSPPSADGANLPRTGPGDRRFLLPLSGAAFMVGGALIGMKGAR